MKRFLLTLCAAFFAAINFAETYGYLTYEYEYDWLASKEGWRITDCDPNATGDLLVPSEIDGRPVFSIASGAFENCENLTSITLSEGIINIEDSAFYCCSNLTSIIIPLSVKYMGNWVFDGCYNLPEDDLGNQYESSNRRVLVCAGEFDNGVCNLPASVNMIASNAFHYRTDLTSVSLPESLTSIGESAFYSCSSLETLVIPSSVTYIGNYAFGKCSNLRRIELSSGITIINTGTFNECINLSSVVIPSSVTEISWAAFSGCTGLTSIEIPENVKVLDSEAFIGCTGLVTITIPSNVTELRRGTFSGCTRLTSVNLPPTMTTIGSKAFSGCIRLESITIPESVTTISNSAFFGCSKLNISIDPGNTTYMSQNGVVFTKDMKKIVCAPMANSEYTIPDGVISIGEGAFSGCTGLTSIVIPKSVTSIEASAFSGCTGLTSIEIPEGVTSIGYSAFSGCTGLTSIEIPEGVTSIGSSAFSGCTGLTSIDIPEGVTSISQYLFSNCSGLTSVNISERITSIGNAAFYNCTGLTSIMIPVSVTSIGDSAFAGCSGLTSITIPDGVTSILYSVFNNCTGLTSVVLPKGLTEIRENAFSNCTKLTSLELPAELTRIGHRAFYACSSLTSLTIPTNVTHVDSHAFDTCTGLTQVSILSKNITLDYNAFSQCYNLETVNFSEGIRTIPENCFKECRALTGIVIPEGVTSIGNSAFNGCSSMTSVTIPSTVTSIGEDAFKAVSPEELTASLIPEGMGRENLITLTIPDGITALKAGAFSDCPMLTTVTIPSTLISLGREAFLGCTALNAVHISDLEAWLSIDFTDITANPLTYASKLYLNGDLVTEVTIPEGSIDIRKYVFSGCADLTSVQIPATVATIGDGAFYNCSSLETLLLPSAVTSIGTSVFTGCDSLMSVGDECEIVTQLQFNPTEGSFGNCVNIMFVIEGQAYGKLPTPRHSTHYFAGWQTCAGAPVNANTIRSAADGDTLVATWKEDVNISVDLNDLSIYKNSSGWTEQSNTTYDGVSAFQSGPISYYSKGDSSISTVVETLAETQLSFYWRFQEDDSADYVAFYIDDVKLDGISSTSSWQKSQCTIPAGFHTLKWTYVKGRQFEDSSVMWVDDIATKTSYQYACSIVNGELTVLGINGPLPKNLSIPGAIDQCPIVAIAEEAFKDCTEICSVEIPETVTSVGASAFSGCHSAAFYFLGSPIDSVGDNAFPGGDGYYCQSTEKWLTAITDAKWKNLSMKPIADVKFFNYTMENNLVRITGVTHGYPSELHIPTKIAGCSVVSIQASAFANLSNLSQVTLPPTITSIGASAFSGCTGLTSIVIPEGVISIESSAFSGCTSVEYVEIPGSVTMIGSKAFQNVAPSSIITPWIPDGMIKKNLISVTIPRDVTIIKDFAFSNCAGICEIVIPENVTSIGASAFSGCTGLTSIVIPENVTSIGVSAFSGCTGLTSIVIPESVTSIGASAFFDCAGISSIVIPEKVTSIGASAFSGCTGLTSLIIPAGVTSVGRNAFYGVAKLIFKGEPPAGAGYSSSPWRSDISYPEEYADAWENAFAIGKCQVSIISSARVSVSAKMMSAKEMEVSYTIDSDLPTAKVRAVAFADGVRSFANVVPVTNGTKVPNGSAVPTRTKHTFTWNVSEDWDTELSKVAIEILVQEGELLPRRRVGVPALNDWEKMTITTNTITSAQAFNALLWCVAEGDTALTISNGVVRASGTQIASGISVSQNANLLNYLYGKMGYQVLSGSRLVHVKSVTRLNLPSSGLNQVAYKIEEESTEE